MRYLLINGSAAQPLSECRLQSKALVQVPAPRVSCFTKPFAKRLCFFFKMTPAPSPSLLPPARGRSHRGLRLGHVRAEFSASSQTGCLQWSVLTHLRDVRKLFQE